MYTFWRRGKRRLTCIRAKECTNALESVRLPPSDQTLTLTCSSLACRQKSTADNRATETTKQVGSLTSQAHEALSPRSYDTLMITSAATSRNALPSYLELMFTSTAQPQPPSVLRPEYAADDPTTYNLDCMLTHMHAYEYPSQIQAIRQSVSVCWRPHMQVCKCASVNTDSRATTQASQRVNGGGRYKLARCAKHISRLQCGSLTRRFHSQGEKKHCKVKLWYTFEKASQPQKYTK